MSLIALVLAVVAVIASVSSVLVFLRLRKIDGSHLKRLDDRASKLESRLGDLDGKVSTLRSSVDTLSTQGAPVISPAPAPAPPPTPAPPAPSPPKRVFRPGVTPSEVAATSQALSGEANRAHALADLLRGVEQISGGTNVAVTRLASIEDEALQERRVADQTMDYLKLADRDPDQAALRKDAIEAAYRNLGQDPAGPVAAKIDAVIADHVIGVLTAVWQRDQEDQSYRDILNQLCACCDVTIVGPRPGDPYDPENHEFSDRVDGGNPDRINRTVVPGILLHGQRIRKPLVKVFKGS